MSSPCHPWRVLFDSISPFFLYFSFLSFSVYFLHNELFLELDNPIVMASLRYSAAEKSVGTLNASHSFTRKRLPRSAREPHRLSRVLTPRRAGTLPVQDATANFRSSTPLRDRFCAALDGVSPEHLVIDQSVPQRSHRPSRVAEYQPHRGWKFSDWFWWPRNTSKTRRWHTGSISF